MPEDDFAVEPEEKGLFFDFDVQLDFDLLEPLSFLLKV